jgi:hypothetical protein
MSILASPQKKASITQHLFAEKKRLFLFFFLLYSPGDYTQDLMLVRQGPLPLEPCLCFWFVFQIESHAFLPNLAPNHDPPTSTSQVARITGVCYLIQSKVTVILTIINTKPFSIKIHMLYETYILLK